MNNSKLQMIKNDILDTVKDIYHYEHKIKTYNRSSSTWFDYYTSRLYSAYLRLPKLIQKQKAQETTKI